MKAIWQRLCMFCGGLDGHKGDELVCRIKGAAMSALMASLPPAEAMLIADRTPFLSELEKRLPKEVRS